MSSSIEDILYRVAARLGPLRERMVFVGGAARGFLVTDPAVEGPRPTDDVDLIVEVSPHSEYGRLEGALRAHGFSNDMREGAPLCRFVHGDLTIDVMPTQPETLGFSNPWYPHALRTATPIELHAAGQSPLTVRVISAPSFLATKLVSYAARGEGDPYHHDLEDLVAIANGRESLVEEVEREPEELRRYVATALTRLFDEESLEDVVPGHLAGDSASQGRKPRVVTALRRLARHPVIARLGEERRSSHAGGPGATGEALEGPWTYQVHGAEFDVAMPQHRSKEMLVVVSARLTSHGPTAGTTGDGRGVLIEDAHGHRHPPNYSATVALRKERSIDGPCDTIWPDTPFETLWVYDVPRGRAPYRLLLPLDGIEIPLEMTSDA